MNRLFLAVLATALTTSPFHLQAQTTETDRDISVVEFRQALVDLGAYLDARKGTDLRRQFEMVPEDILQKMHSAVANKLQFKNAVAGLKTRSAELAARSLLPQQEVRAASLDPQAVFPSCPANTIIDTAAASPCTPAYPDPNSPDWQAVVTPLIIAGAFFPPDYTSVSHQACGLKTETNLQQVTVALQGLVNSLTPVCAIIPAPLNATCLLPLTGVALADSISAGLYSDCLEQDALINAAEIDAGFHNTVTIYNKLTGVDSHLTNVNTDFDSRITNVQSDVDSRITSSQSDIDTRISNVSTQVTNVNNQITGEFNALDNHLTNVDNHVSTEFSALDTHMVSLVNQLSATLGQDTALLGAELKQVMKLLLTPDGLKALNPGILTCTGTNCPNVLANCPAAGCSWNNIGPLP